MLRGCSDDKSGPILYRSPGTRRSHGARARACPFISLDDSITRREERLYARLGKWVRRSEIDIGQRAEMTTS